MSAAQLMQGFLPCKLIKPTHLPVQIHYAHVNSTTWILFLVFGWIQVKSRIEVFIDVTFSTQTGELF